MSTGLPACFARWAICAAASPNDGSGLLFCFAIHDTVQSSEVDQVSKTIRFRKDQMVGIETDPNGASLRTSGLFDRLRLKLTKTRQPFASLTNR